ncbi:MAG: PQQ-dependent dehydrogenase, methanol/ethanol family [Gammaproteobacteria bacterium]|nr:PQQ-dependent dehydrogenase, methanol/ethanol family [Gammaproteobacteria bacterium]
MTKVGICGTTLVWLLAAGASCAEVDTAAIAARDQGGNWLSYGHDYTEQRYSPLDQIDQDSVGKLGLAWYLDLPGMHSLNSTPLVVDGVIYFSGSWSVVTAVDARSGKLRWQHDPKTLEHVGDNGRILWDFNRGIAYWQGKVYVGTGDGRLLALDAQTGEELWSTLTLDRSTPRTINGAPRVFNGLVLIGHGGADLGPVRGYVTAYDAETGEQRWRFYTVPGNPAEGFENEAMQMAAKTWTGQWWQYGGGGTVWNSMTYDPELNRIYLGTGNGAPWNRKIRSPDGGDNLFLCSIVALDADTGAYLWHYQTSPGETWDFNSAMDIVLADLDIDGRKRKVLMHAPKNGFFYVIDRMDGKLLSAEKFGKVTWAERVDLATGRPVEADTARYLDGETLIWPGPLGAHNWHPMSYNPITGLVYLPYQELPGYYNDKGINARSWRSVNFVPSLGVSGFEQDIPAQSGWSALIGWDPVAQREMWKVKTPGLWNAGTLTTAGKLVFQGRTDGRLLAYAADSGEALWRYDTGVGISAPPITYAVDGRQYVALLAGWGGAAAALGGSIADQHGWQYGVHPRRLLVFALGGAATLPPAPAPIRPAPIDEPLLALDPERVRSGQVIFSAHCSVCHGSGGAGGGYAPDVRASAVAANSDTLAETVHAGRPQLGMPAFPELARDDLEALYQFIRQAARRESAARAGGR